MQRQLHLNLFFHSRGHHEASWRHPELRRRGLFRTEYSGTTLREHYDLDWPKTAFEPAAAAE